MNRFAFMIHPIEPQKDVARKFPLLGKLPAGIIDYFSRFFPPIRLSHITGIRSESAGEEVDGWLLACPLTAKRMLDVPLPVAYRKVIQTGQLAEQLGAQILGLGAFTSVVGDAGITVSQELSIPVTTGNSYTIYVAVEAALAAARRLGLEPDRCTGAVVGAYGSTGRACARLLAEHLPDVLLIGRNADRLANLQREIASAGGTARTSTSLEAIRQADVVLTVTSATEPIIEPEHLKPGSIVCDVARPRNVSRQVAQVRQDVLVIEGGIVEMPGQVDFGFDFGFPPGQAYACMAETAILALEGRNECYTLGRDISLERVKEIASLGAKHGFCLAGFRSFERAVSEHSIEHVRATATRMQRPASWAGPSRIA